MGGAIMGKHKCVDCGFLSAKNIYTRNLEEVEKEFRRSGNSPYTILGGKEIGYHTHKEYPICFVQKYNLLDSFKKTSGQESTKFLLIINKERECELFREWQQGFAPKEHREMLDRENMLKWQVEREESDKKWREQQEKRRSKEEWRRYIFLAVFTIVSVIIGVILGYLIP